MQQGFPRRRQIIIFGRNCSNYAQYIHVNKLIQHTTLLIAHMPSNILHNQHNQISVLYQSGSDPQAVHSLHLLSATSIIPFIYCFPRIYYSLRKLESKCINRKGAYDAISKKKSKYAASKQIKISPSRKHGKKQVLTHKSTCATRYSQDSDSQISQTKEETLKSIQLGRFRTSGNLWEKSYLISISQLMNTNPPGRNSLKADRVRYQFHSRKMTLLKLNQMMTFLKHMHNASVTKRYYLIIVKDI